MLPGLMAGPSLDAAVFTLAAERATHGVLPYVGTWDHKPPGVYAAFTMAIGLLGWLQPWSAVWATTVACVAGAGAFLTAIAVRITSRGIAVLVGVAGAAAMSQFIVSLGGGLTESVAALPIAAAMWLTVPRPTGWGRWAAAGALAIAALVTSLIVLGAVAALFVLALRSSSPRAAVLAGLGGAAAVLAGLMFLLASLGMLETTLGTVIGYNAAYRATSGLATSIGGARQASGVVLSYLFIILPAAMGALAARRRPEQVRTVALACLAWLTAAGALLAIHGRFETHYAIPLAIPLALMAAAGLDDAIAAWRRGGAVRVMGAIPVGIAALVSATVVTTTAPEMVRSLTAENQRVGLVASHVGAASEPGESLFVWGNEPQIYLAANRPPSSRYVYLYPLTTPGYSSPEQIAEILTGWHESPPTFVIDAGSIAPGESGDPPLLIDRTVAADGRDYDALDPLRDFVRDRYVLEMIIDGWPIYRLVAP